MALAPISGAAPAATQPGTTQDTATSAFNLSFESLLKIILTQLTYQDPLKPMDNFEFVSQLAQFSQIQLGQTTNDKLEQLVASQVTAQATSLLGKTVDIPAGASTLTGKITNIAFADGVPKVTLKTTGGQSISNISISGISQVTEGNKH